MVSNYTTNHIRGIVDALPPWVERRYAPKDGSTKHSTLPSKYWTMNVAPKDFPFFDGEDYSEACGQQKRCGIELATNGKYYACPMSGGIDRIFKLDVGVSSFSELIKPEIYKNNSKYYVPYAVDSESNMHLINYGKKHHGKLISKTLMSIRRSSKVLKNGRCIPENRYYQNHGWRQ
jgi:hypothetical protein